MLKSHIEVFNLKPERWYTHQVIIQPSWQWSVGQL